MGGKEETGKIFVGGLSWNTDQDSLQSYFGQFGEITDCIVMKNPATGKSRGFGFVSFKDSSTVDVILSTKNHQVDGRTVDAKACNARGTMPKPQGSRGGGGGNGGGGGMIGRTTKIFVGGLPNNIDESTIKDSFSRFGNVTEVVIMFDHEKGRSRGFGFLTFDNEDSVEQACSEHYVDVNGKQVECKKAEPRMAGGRGGGGGGRGGGRGGGPPGGGFGGSQGWGQGGQQGGGGQGWNQGGWNQDWSGQQAWGQQGNWNANGWGQGGGYGDNQQSGYGAQQSGYGSQQSGYGAQQSSYGSQQGGYGAQSGQSQSPGGSYGQNGSSGQQGMGGGYQQRQAPGNTSGGSGRGGGSSQNFHPYSR